MNRTTELLDWVTWLNFILVSSSNISKQIYGELDFVLFLSNFMNWFKSKQFACFKNEDEKGSANNDNKNAHFYKF